MSHIAGNAALRRLVNAPKSYIAFRFDHVENGHEVGPTGLTLKACDPVGGKVDFPVPNDLPPIRSLMIGKTRSSQFKMFTARDTTTATVTREASD